MLLELRNRPLDHKMQRGAVVRVVVIVGWTDEVGGIAVVPLCSQGLNPGVQVWRQPDHDPIGTHVGFFLCAGIIPRWVHFVTLGAKKSVLDSRNSGFTRYWAKAGGIYVELPLDKAYSGMRQ